MNQTKYCSANRSSRQKALILLASVLVMVMAAVGGTIAYLIAKTDAVENVFTYGTMENSVVEDLTGGVKKDVKVINTGNVDSFIRAKVVINWKDADGNIRPAVQGTDYNIQWGTGWKNLDGIYYYPASVAPGASTGNLINSCEKIGTPPEGFDLSVEILAESIQAEPANAVQEAWGVTVTGSDVVKGGAGK